VGLGWKIGLFPQILRRKSAKKLFPPALTRNEGALPIIYEELHILHPNHFYSEDEPKIIIQSLQYNTNPKRALYGREHIIHNTIQNKIKTEN